MSFLAKLNLDGEEFVVLKCHFKVNQATDHNGMPSSQPVGGKIQLVIESNVKLDFFDWSISSNATKDGEIVFYKRDNISSLKSVQFKEAYCTEYIEDFDAVDSQPLRTTITISAREVTMRGTTLNNNWPSKANLN